MDEQAFIGQKMELLRESIDSYVQLIEMHLKIEAELKTSRESLESLKEKLMQELAFEERVMFRV